MRNMAIEKRKQTLPITLRLTINIFGSLAILPFGMLYSVRDTYFYFLFSTVIFELYAWMPYFFKILHKENISNKLLVVTISLVFLLALFMVNQLLFLISVIIYTANFILYYLPAKVNYNTFLVQFTERVKPIDYCFKNKYFLQLFLLFFPVNLLLFYLLSF